MKKPKYLNFKFFKYRNLQKFFAVFLIAPAIFLLFNFAVKKLDYVMVVKKSVIDMEQKNIDIANQQESVAEQKKKERPKLTVKPQEAKGIYLTMWTASSPRRMAELLQLIDETEINSVVIDVKGSEGELIYEMSSKIEGLLLSLREKNIYTIARIVVFQDSGYAESYPEIALKTASGKLWRDRRGFAWLDPATKKSWEHIVDVAKKTIDLGFDEIQYDYIRFPTDGNLSAIVYPVWDGVTPRNEILRSFFEYSQKAIKEYNPETQTSIDIFGYTFLRNDDLGIGQTLVDVIDNFDFISPMVYPSHYSNGNFGFENPAEHPYEVVKNTLEQGFVALGEERAALAKPKIRPWLQVFDIGARYDSEKIKAQIQAVYDAGGTSWMLWDPNNRYEEVKKALEGMAQE